MAKVTNLTREGMDFIVGVKDGAALTEHLKGFETREIAIDVESVTVRARLHAASISIAPAPRARGPKSEYPAL